MPAVVPGEMLNFKPATVATSATTANVGGAITATQITMGSFNELFYTVEAEASGGSSIIQHAKCFHKNTNTTNSVTSYGIYIANAIDDLATAYQIELTPGSALDGSGKKARILGFNASDEPIQDEVALAGATTVTSSLAFKGKVRVEIRENDSAAALDVAESDILIEHNGVAKGYVPQGASTANNEADIGLEASLGGSTTIALPSTAPSSVTFTRPRTEASRLLVNGGGGTLAATLAQAFWWKWTVVPTMIPSGECQFFVRGRGSAAA